MLQISNVSRYIETISAPHTVGSALMAEVKDGGIALMTKNISTLVFRETAEPAEGVSGPKKVNGLKVKDSFSKNARRRPE